MSTNKFYPVVWAFVDSEVTTDDPRMKWINNEATGFNVVHLLTHRQHISDAFEELIPVPANFLGADDVSAFKTQHSILDYVFFWAQAQLAQHNLQERVHITQVTKHIANQSSNLSYFLITLNNYISLNPYAQDVAAKECPATASMTNPIKKLMELYFNVAAKTKFLTQTCNIKPASGLHKQTTVPLVALSSPIATSTMKTIKAVTGTVPVEFIYNGQGIVGDTVGKQVTMLVDFPLMNEGWVTSGFTEADWKKFFITLFSKQDAAISNLQVATVSASAKNLGVGSTNNIIVTFTGTATQDTKKDIQHTCWKQFIKSQFMDALLTVIFDWAESNSLKTSASTNCYKVLTDATISLKGELKSSFKLVHAQQTETIGWNDVRQVTKTVDWSLAMLKKDFNFGGKKKTTRKKTTKRRRVLRALPF